MVRNYLPLMLTEVKRSGRALRLESEDIGVWKPRWKMVFTWQCPIMSMAYSVCFFLAGLTIFVCTPLIRRKPWGTESNVSCLPICNIIQKASRLLTDQKIAVVYLSVSAIAGGTLMFCSFWIYHYIDLEDDDKEGDDIEPTRFMLSKGQPSSSQELR